MFSSTESARPVQKRRWNGYHPCSGFGGLCDWNFLLQRCAYCDGRWSAHQRRTTAEQQTFMRQSLPTGGEQATYMTTATPAGVISFYMQILPAGGWEVTDSDEESGAASLQATNGAKYLALNAGGPTGTTYVKVCVWPTRPSDNRCE